MTLRIRLVAPHELEVVRQLLLANGWTGPRFDPGPFAAMVAGSYEAFVALDGGRVVGFARSLSDGVSNGYLCTLVVDADHRHRGVARALVRQVMGERRDMTWVLRAERPGLSAFYEKLGFRGSQVTMERVRTE